MYLNIKSTAKKFQDANSSETQDSPQSKIAKTNSTISKPTHSNTNYENPIKDAMTTVIIQNHLQKLMD
jgi:hypothetical protein